VPGYGHRYWAERTPTSRRSSRPALRGDHHADVVVIGGGLTGCTAAYVLAAGGLKVVLVEAERLAGGSTGGSLGTIVPQPDAGFRAVDGTAGRRTARTAWKEARRSALEFASALKRLRIKCDLAPTSLLINAVQPADGAALERERSARKAAGLEAPWLGGSAAARELGTDSAGAIRLADAHMFDPVRAALGLAAAAEAKGAVIVERSAVRRTRFTRNDAEVVLASGRVRANGVFVATGAPGAVFGQLKRHVRAMDGHVVVTEPLPAAMRRETGTREAIVTEFGSAPHWLRWLSDGRALFAGALSAPAGPRQQDKIIVARTAQLMYELSLRYPAISGLPAKWGWPVPIVCTADGLPWIGPHRNYPFHFFALAFGWHGDGLAWFAAKAALRHFTGETRSEDGAFGFLR
jgi:glycine/D-amino acid oxidase-like deaminating enzyme